MMKIEIKLNPDNIVILNNVLSGVYSSNPSTKTGKITKCILMDVCDKIASKKKDLERKQTLFDSKKKVTLSLKYSQAFYLSHFLLNLPEFDNVFQDNQIQKIINLLDQKLC